MVVIGEAQAAHGEGAALVRVGEAGVAQEAREREVARLTLDRGLRVKALADEDLAVGRAEAGPLVRGEADAARGRSGA